MLRKIIPSVLLATLLFSSLFAVGAVFAENSNDDDSPEVEVETSSASAESSERSSSASSRSVREEQRELERERMIQSAQSARSERRCEVINANIDRVTANYNRNHQSRVQRFTSIAENIQKALTRLAELGYDVTDLQAKLAELKTMITEFAGLNTELQGLLNAAKELDCADGSGEFRATLEDAKAVTQEMQAKAKEIFNFIQTEIRPALKQVKEQKPE